MPAASDISIHINGVEQVIRSDTTLAGLLESLQLKSKFVAVERNLEVVPRTEHANCVLQTGDELEIVTLVGGG